MPSRVSLRERYLQVVARITGSRPGGPHAIPAPESAPPKPRRLSPAERAARFTVDVRTLDAGQLEALIAASTSIDQEARAVAWHEAKPFLAAADRKDLLTNLREELRRWTASASSDTGRANVALVRRRAGPPLLDAAAAVIAQDRIAKRHFEVLYTPFRAALTGEPIRQGAPGTGRRRTRRPADEEADRAQAAAAATPSHSLSSAAAAAAKVIAGTAVSAPVSGPSTSVVAPRRPRRRPLGEAERGPAQD